MGGPGATAAAAGELLEEEGTRGGSGRVAGATDAVGELLKAWPWKGAGSVGDNTAPLLLLLLPAGGARGGSGRGLRALRACCC